MKVGFLEIELTAGIGNNKELAHMVGLTHPIANPVRIFLPSGFPLLALRLPSLKKTTMT
jgi:hypothetical protein